MEQNPVQVWLSLVTVVCSTEVVEEFSLAAL